MTDLYRLVSPEKLELYDLKKDGELVFCQSIDISHFNFKKIKLLVLSAYFVNWDMTRIENTAYRPLSSTNLFASKTIFEKENLIITAPFHNVSTGFWAQGWAPKSKLVSTLRNISKGAKVYAESITILANDNTTTWQSGPITLNNSNETGFTARYSTGTIHRKVVTTLDGFSFIPRAAFNLYKQKKPYPVILTGLALLSSIIFAWEFSVKEALKNNREPTVIFDNRLLGLDLINKIQNFVPNGATERIAFDQRTQQMRITFMSKAKAVKFFESISAPPKSIGGWNISIIDHTVIFEEIRKQ